MRLSYTISPDRRTLTVTAGKSARAELAELGQEIHSDNSLYEAFEQLICNSELTWIPSVVFMDLTEAPILGILGDEQWVSEHKDGDGTIFSGADHTRKGKPILVQPVIDRWGYLDYSIKSPLQDLRDTGKAIFTAP